MSKRNIRKYNRSGYKKCPICLSKVKLVKHHINGRNIKNYDDPWNTTWICPNCHDLIHDGQIIIEGKFKKELIWHKKGEESITGINSSPYKYN
jgi:uncharacterized protein YlaI